MRKIHFSVFLVPLVLASFAACGGSSDDASLPGSPVGGAAGAGGGAAGKAGTAGAAGKAGGGGAAGMSGGGGATGDCGNGKVEAANNEDCDDGNKVSGDGCEADCTLTCNPETNGNAKCDDKNPCNGTETCVGKKGSAVCQKGTPLADGAACGTGMVCVAGTCTLPSCGDGKVQVGEECDDGNAVKGDGCEVDCKFSCKTGDPTRDCKSSDPCVSDGVCNDATKVCKAGAPTALGTPCGTGQICKAGLCKASLCGDGFVDAAKGEQCDDGNTSPGDGCSATCKGTCANPATDCPAPSTICEVAVCAASVCSTSPAAEGQTCGNGLVCTAGKCVAPGQVCGNGKLEMGESCDDGNATPGDGCETNCTFTCKTAATDCPAAPACQSAVCTDVTAGGSKVGQKCGTQANAALEGMSGPGCAAPSTCKSGACSAPGAVCGNGTVEQGESCDFGAQNGAGTGCETNCTPSCAKAPDTCPDANVCNGVEACADVTVGGSTGAKCGAGATAPDGTSCGSGTICLAGQCALSSCGDGFVDAAAGEDCDFGAGNGAGTGCETTCKFSCTKAPDSCPDANPCNGTEACGDVTVGGKAGQACGAGAPLAVGTPCGGGNLCVGSPIACVASSCGDGFVDAASGEQCEPPGVGSCTAQCKTAVAACGDGVVNGTEQCDDGNVANLDGCDSNCRYETAIRMTQVAISGSMAFAGCTPTTNAFGRNVLTSTARDQLNPSLQTGIDAGTTNLIVQALGLADPTGASDPDGLQLGILSGVLDTSKPGAAWPATGNPIDWWFLVDKTQVDGPGLPLSTLPATLTARTLRAGPADTMLQLLLSGVPAKLTMRNALIIANIDGNPAPNTPAPPPASLAAGFTHFQTVTATSTGMQGLCGNVTVESLAAIPIPESLTTGTGDCKAVNGSKAYTYCGANMPVGPNCNSLLDAIVGGCKVTFLNITAINASPVPDVAGSGTTPLTLGPGNKVPASQSTGNTNAYSAYFTFKANRAHFTGRTP